MTLTGVAECVPISLSSPRYRARTGCLPIQERWCWGLVSSQQSAERVKFVGYSSKLTVNLSAGTILLDATADIDGVSRSP